MPDVNDYGMKISRAGYDVKTCADHQLLFSSSFKMPLVVLSGEYLMGQGGNPDYSQSQDIVTHNLGFYPIVITFKKASGSTTMHVDTHSGSDPGLLIKTDKLSYIANSATENQEYAYFIMNVDLEEDYTAPIIDTSAIEQGSTPQDYGFKVSNSGVDVKTASLSDLASSSGVSAAGTAIRHQLIHKVGGVDNVGNGATATVAHGLGYAPMSLWYRRHEDGPNHYWWCNMYEYSINLNPGSYSGETRCRTYADATNIYFYNYNMGEVDLRYVIFKDPLF